MIFVLWHGVYDSKAIDAVLVGPDDASLEALTEEFRSAYKLDADDDSARLSWEETARKDLVGDEWAELWTGDLFPLWLVKRKSWTVASGVRLAWFGSYSPGEDGVEVVDGLAPKGMQ